MVSTKNQKDEVILDRCAVIDAATAVFRFNVLHAVIAVYFGIFRVAKGSLNNNIG